MYEGEASGELHEILIFSRFFVSRIFTCSSVFPNRKKIKTTNDERGNVGGSDWGWAVELIGRVTISGKISRRY